MSHATEIERRMRPVHYKLVRPIQQPTEFYLPYGWGCAAFTHWDGARTSFHFGDGCCPCAGLLYPRLESFHFAVKNQTDKPVILRLSTHATHLLWSSHEYSPLEHGECLRAWREGKGKRARVMIHRLTEHEYRVTRPKLDLSREQLQLQLFRIFQVPEDERPTVFW